MAERDVERLWRRLDAYGKRIGMVEQSVTDLVRDLKPLLANYNDAERRRAGRRKWARVAVVVCGLVFALPAFIDQIVRLATGHP